MPPKGVVPPHLRKKKRYGKTKSIQGFDWSREEPPIRDKPNRSIRSKYTVAAPTRWLLYRGSRSGPCVIDVLLELLECQSVSSTCIAAGAGRYGCCVSLGLALARSPSMGDWEVDWVWTLWWTVVAGVGFMLLLLSRGECRLWLTLAKLLPPAFRCANLCLPVPPHLHFLCCRYIAAEGTAGARHGRLGALAQAADPPNDEA